VLSVVHRSRARQDLKDIYHHLADENAAAARRLLQNIDRKIALVAEFPDIGSPHPEFGPNARLLVVGSYVVLYDRLPDTVEIVRVLHGARDLSNLL
jgi:toxin ParE1/3/4